MRNDKTFAIKKWTTVYTENGETYRLTAVAELRSLSGQSPYFSLTGEQYQKTSRGGWREDSFGRMHDTIKKHFPALKQFIKWHLVSIGQPLHYVANSLYWAGLQGWTDGKNDSPPNYDYLVSTSKWGTVEGDELIDLHEFIGSRDKNLPENKEKADVLTKILESRLEKLQNEFYYAMAELFSKDEVNDAIEFNLGR